MLLGGLLLRNLPLVRIATMFIAWLHSAIAVMPKFTACRRKLLLKNSRRRLRQLRPDECVSCPTSPEGMECQRGCNPDETFTAVTPAHAAKKEIWAEGIGGMTIGYG